MTRAGAGARRVLDLIARHGGGGQRRIARSAGIVVERGRGSYVYASNGSSYLDAISGFGVASLGHSHPYWVEAVVAQASKLVVTPLHTDELARYLGALAAVLPAPLDRIALFSGGAEAVEAAIRLAQTATGRPGVVTFTDSFHGKTAAVRYAGGGSVEEAAVLAPRWLRTLAYPECEDHDAVDYSHCEEASDVDALLAASSALDGIGAVLVEPILGTAGNIPPRRPFLRALRQACDERGWLLILDESITGFGRTGELFGFELFGVVPDIVVLGKGMGGGVPLSAVCASPELWDASALAAPSATSSSYGGNPLACAAGLATLEILTRDGFLDGLRDVASRAAARLRELAEASDRVARPRGAGLMLGLDLVDPETGARAPVSTCGEVFRACRDRGVLIVADVPRVRLNPPLTLSHAEADQLFDVLHEVLT